MSASQRGYIGLGTTLSYSTDGGTTWLPVARLTDIGDIGFGEADAVDVTGYDTPTRTREKIKGLEDAGEVDLTGIWTADARQQAVMALDDVIKWQIVLPNSLGEIELDGYFTSFTITPQLEDRIEWSGTLVISGKPTLTVTP